MSGLAVWRERWLATYRHQQVRLWSPLPCDECLYRLRQVTTRKHGTRYLANRFDGGRPVLYGRIRDNRIQVSRWPDINGRQKHFYAARLTAVAEQAPQGGTTVTGTTGVPASLLATRVVLTVISCAVVVSMPVTGFLRPAFLPALVWLVVSAFGQLYGPARYEQSAAALQEVTASLLDSSPVTTTAPELPSAP
jgi:hypothetical protein